MIIVSRRPKIVPSGRNARPVQALSQAGLMSQAVFRPRRSGLVVQASSFTPRRSGIAGLERALSHLDDLVEGLDLAPRL
eukprot:1010235-Heterocapsa_arctica.AAC.1